MAAPPGPGVSGKSRAARVLGRTMRQTSVFDRKGTRWIIQVLSPPPTVIVLIHRGRKSGRLYKTPLSILVEDPQRGESSLVRCGAETPTGTKT